MDLWINELHVDAQPGQTLLEIVKALKMDRESLKNRPLAAKIAGEVFTLNYVPCRDEEGADGLPQRRKAMEASGGRVQLLPYGDKLGRAVYARSLQFVLFLAIRELWPQAQAVINFSVGSTVNVTVDREPSFTAADVPALKRQMEQIVRQDIPLIRHRISTAEAKEFFETHGQPDKARLLHWREKDYFDVYSYGDYMDYFYGEMTPSTGYMTVWNIVSDGSSGIQLCYPDLNDPEKPAVYEPKPNFTAVCAESERWCTLMECDNLADLNDLVQQGKLRELVRVSEALHERSFSQIADQIVARKAKAVLLAGPSSSGKTTSANRLAVQLRVHGKKAILISLDDYYIDRDKIAPGPDGKLDLEHINTIDTELFKSHLKQLLEGRTVNLPRFDFTIGKRVKTDTYLTLDEDTVVIIEGLHGLNPAMLPDEVDRNLVFRMYVSALYPLNMDNHNRIATSYLRLLRRIVRDYETRNASVSHTLSMWDSVRRGEERWIFPYQENADVIFNSSLVYELAVLKKEIFPLLDAITQEDPYYEDVRSIVKVLNYVLPADVEEEIPPTSILREFIGGNSFYKK